MQPIKVILPIFAIFALAGCADDVTLDKEANIMPVDYAKQAREIFDKYAGNYESLTPQDKERYLKLFENDEEKGRKIWDLMKNPPSQGLSGVPNSPQ